MTKETVERIIEGQIQPIFGFCLKKCANLQDAEDLTQEISFKAFKTLRIREDIEDVQKFIWTIAHNALANYYRAKGRHAYVSVETMENVSIDSADAAERLIEKETCERLQREIAYLSKLQRRIVIAYYYENKTQEDIASELEIPIGTVKWHLFEAKKELKRSMETVRTTNQLKFNPIKFSSMGLNGNVGTMGGTQNFFRSSLSQNIAYCVYRQAKSVHDIADALGVSPVYIESEVDFLEEYGYLIKKDNKYLANLLIEDPEDANGGEIIKLHDEMYEKAAKLFANALYDELTSDGALDWEDIDCLYKEDRNYLLWALIPYIAACSAEEGVEAKIKFEEVATLRPDGAHNIGTASVDSLKWKAMRYYDKMQQWCGPCWCGNADWIMWGFKSEWSTDREMEYWNQYDQKTLGQLHRIATGDFISEDECASLVERGFITVKEGKPIFTLVHVTSKATKEHLLEIGRKIKREQADVLSALKEPFYKAVMAITPKHLKKVQEYQMQYIFHADGWFLLYCLKELLSNGKLQLPTEEQRKSISMLHIPS